MVAFDKAGKALSISGEAGSPQIQLGGDGALLLRRAVADIAASIRPSARGELEITDVNRRYLEMGQLDVLRLGRGFAWLDTGTPDSLADATNYVRALEKRQGLRICCPEEIAFEQGFIDAGQLEALGAALGKSAYGQYLVAIARGAGG